MKRRRVFVTVAVALGLVLVLYAVAGVRLGFLARDIRDQGKELTTLLGAEKSDNQRLKEVLSQLAVDAKRAVDGISQPMWKPIIWASGRSAQFGEIQAKAQDAIPLLDIAPGALGIDKPRKYLLVFQNSAEARGTGGIIGGYAEVEVSSGRIKTLRVGSNADLHSMKRLPIKISKEYMEIYGNDPAIWQNSNLSPHFPYGARIWLALWKAQFKENLDGVITIDPIALSSILKVIGPVTMPDGSVITSENVVEDTLSLAYQRFEKDNTARKNYLAQLARIILQNMSQGSYSKTNLVRELVGPIEEGRILFYSTNAVEEKVVAKTLIGGVLDNQPNNEYRLVIVNSAGNKMDYYLDRKLTLTSDACSPKKLTTVKMKLTNTVERWAKLPSYVKGRLDLREIDGVGNSHGVVAFIYGPSGGKLISRSSPLGDQSIFKVKVERKRPLLMVYLDLKPGRPVTVTAQFEGGIGPITLVDQPLVRPMVSEIADSCGS